MHKPRFQNSAGRLLAALSNVAAPGTSASYRKVISGHLGIEADEKRKIKPTYKALRLLQKCFEEFWADVEGAPELEQLRPVILTSLSKLTATAYPTNFDAQFPIPSAAEVGMIEVAARALPQEQELEQSDVDRIRESISALRNMVKDADISSSLRAVILDLIRLSEEALSHYDIRGAKGLKKAFVQMLGETSLLYASEAKAGRRGEAGESKFWAAIHRHLQIVDATLAKVQQYQPLLEAGATFFLGGPPGA